MEDILAYASSSEEGEEEQDVDVQAEIKQEAASQSESQEKCSNIKQNWCEDLEHDDDDDISIPPASPKAKLAMFDAIPEIPKSPRNQVTESKMQERMIDLSDKLKNLEMNFNEYKFETRQFRNPKYFDICKESLGMSTDWFEDGKYSSNLDSSIFNPHSFWQQKDSYQVLIHEFELSVQRRIEEMQKLKSAKEQSKQRQQKQEKLQKLQQIQEIHRRMKSQKSSSNHIPHITLNRPLVNGEPPYKRAKYSRHSSKEAIALSSSSLLGQMHMANHKTQHENSKHRKSHKQGPRQSRWN